MSQENVIIDLIAVVSLIIVLILLYGGATQSKKPNQKKQNRLKMLLDKEAEMEQQEYQRRIEEVRPDLINTIQRYTFIQPLLRDVKDALGWKRAAIEPYEGWGLIGNYMHPNESYEYVYGYALHEYKVQKNVDRKLQPNNSYALVSKKCTFHRGVAIVAAKRKSARDIKLYIAEYDSPSNEVNTHGELRRCRLIEVNGNSPMAHEEAILKAMKEYVKQNRGKELW